MNPKVSVLMAVHNGAAFLREAVDSILAQTFADFEFIVVDDGSTDDTPAILREYAQAEPRIVLLRHDHNIGLTRSLNRGLQAARGAYVARQDADDVSLPTRLEKETMLLDERPEVVLVSGNQHYVDGPGRFLFKTQLHDPPAVIAWKLLFYNHIGGHSAVMFRRELVVSMKGYAEDHATGQDYELWLRLARRGEFVVLPDVLLRHRVHAASVSARKRQEQDDLSLLDTGCALSALLSRDLSRAVILALRGFWTDQAPDGRTLSQVDGWLRDLYEAYVRTHQSAAIEGRLLGEQLRYAIADRYAYWAQAASKRCQPVTAFRRLYLAFSWYPPGFPRRKRIRALRDQLWLLRQCLGQRIQRSGPRPTSRAGHDSEASGTEQPSESGEEDRS